MRLGDSALRLRRSGPADCEAGLPNRGRPEPGVPTNLGNWAIENEVKDVLLHPVFTEIRGSGGPTVVMRDTLVHDGWERVTAAYYLRDGSQIASESFSFDREGNIFLASESRSYDVSTTRLLSRAGSSYSYDRAGNQVEGPVPGGNTFCFSYDGLDRLVAVRKKVGGSCGPVAARYAYDVLGRRIVKRVYGTYGGLSPVYLRMIYRGGQVVAETDSVGSSLSLAYSWGFGADDLVAIYRYSDSGHWYVVQDHLRSVRGLTTKAGTWAASCVSGGHRLRRIGGQNCALASDPAGG